MPNCGYGTIPAPPPASRDRLWTSLTRVGNLRLQVPQAVTECRPHRRDRRRKNRRVAEERGLDRATEEHLRRAVDSLSEEFGEGQEQDTIERVMDDSVSQLA